jgi:hypothetical protein
MDGLVAADNAGGTARRKKGEWNEKQRGTKGDYQQGVARDNSLKLILTNLLPFQRVQLVWSRHRPHRHF